MSENRDNYWADEDEDEETTNVYESDTDLVKKLRKALKVEQRKNKELAKSIYDTSKIKYETGVGSNLDVIYAQAAYREAEINFLSAVYDLIVAQVDYLKAKGTLVK